ncbi:MAG: MFS transporter [Chloroflexi bacterium]|nr:MFS transporter [Chloroflexota bacterium]
MTTRRNSVIPVDGAPRIRFPIILLVRTIINIPLRIIYPFLPSIARGLGISLTAASGLITLRLMGRMASPLLGPLADRYGRRRVMEAALFLFALASLLLAGVGTFAAAVIAFALYGISKALYDPAVYAYLGDAVPYRERGRAVGIAELSWSAAWLLGVPASGALIDRLGWRAPWAVLTVLGVLGVGLVRVGLPSTLPQSVRRDDDVFIVSVIATWRSLLRRRPVIVLLLTFMLLTLSMEIPFIVYGAWLEDAFGLSFTALGLASAVVGLAEAAAECSTTVITDRIGKRRSVLVGLLGLALSLFALPWLSRLGLVPALAGIGLMMLTFEFGIVSLMPLATELAPDARATLLSLIGMTFGLSRILAALIGGWLWRWQPVSVQNPIALHAGVGAVCAIVAAVLLARGVENDSVG